MTKIYNRPVHIFTDGVDTPLKINKIPINHFTRVVNTNGTTPVNVFGTLGGAPSKFTVTAVISLALDTTAGNIVLSQKTNTVATIAKGVTAGVLVGATSLANTVYAAGDACTVVSSTAGNSSVIIHCSTV